MVVDLFHDLVRTNDLHSHSHATDIGDSMDSLMEDYGLTVEQADLLTKRITDLWCAIADMDKPPAQ